ncbi:Fatty acyl-CoA synthetase A [Symbiodinium microadriaticum]|uniref:Fatty acyl-CoA synthetase A n=1 Tax=Symbiodinium microadriaticum TaxID=2951 RepID=A0A1Q9BU01_SYMMI|nr:Fatty acyl-CoA synthetase A [Symbiodinium microadriaticum]
MWAPVEDVPDMGYLRTDQVHKIGSKTIPCCGRGEICLKGLNIFQGYYKMPDKTAEALRALTTLCFSNVTYSTWQQIKRSF